MDINIINGNGEYVRNGINDLYEDAIKYFGDKYEKNILDTINEVLFYEWEDNQTESDVIFDLTDGEIDEEEDDDLIYETAGFYFINAKDKDKCDKIIAFRNKFFKDNYHFLVHELFGHAVFSNVGAVFYDDGKMWKRNGVSFMCDDDNISYYDNLNEGFVEDVVLNILSNAGLEHYFLEQYYYAKQAAGVIRRNIGHENLYDALILGKKSVKDMYNINCKNDYFSQLELILDVYYNYGFHPKLGNLYNKNLNNFIKRKRKIRKLNNR